MNALNIYKAFNGGLWLMEPEAAMLYSPLVNRLLNGEPIDFRHLHQVSEKAEAKIVAQRPKAVYCAANLVEPQFSDLSMAAPNSVSVVPLEGVVMKADFCGAPGLNTLQSWLTEAESNANIIGHIIYTNTPGGNAQGVDEFSKFVANLTKPVVCFVDGMACSAGYWIASACDEVICADKLTTLGSIGAFSTFVDATERDKMHGIRKIEVYAPQSTLKNQMHRDIVSGNTEGFANRFLAPLVADFHKTVTTNRAESADKMGEDVLAGDVFNAEESIANGLADCIGTFQIAIKTVEKLARQKTQTI